MWWSPIRMSTRSADILPDRPPLKKPIPRRLTESPEQARPRPPPRSPLAVPVDLVVSTSIRRIPLMIPHPGDYRLIITYQEGISFPS